MIRFDAAAVALKATPVEVRPDGFRIYHGTAAFGDIVQQYPDLVPPRAEFRPKEEALSDATIKSARGVLLTFEHPSPRNTPSGLLAPETAKDHFEGAVLNAWAEDDKFRVEILVATPEVQREIESGMVDLSLGYTQDLDPTPGSFAGQRYDGIQRNIRVNHLAVVRNARAVRPDGSRARLDSEGAGQLPYPVIKDAGSTMDEKTLPRTDAHGISQEAMDVISKFGDADKKIIMGLLGAKPPAPEDEAAEQAADLEQDKAMIAPLEQKVADLESRLAKCEEFMQGSMQDSKARSDAAPTVVTPIVDVDAVLARAEKSAQARFDASAKFVSAVTSCGHKAATVEDAATVMLTVIKEHLPGLHASATADVKNARFDSLTATFKEADRLRGEKLVQDSASALFNPKPTPAVEIPLIRI